jgi:hypothetical protein
MRAYRLHAAFRVFFALLPFLAASHPSLPQLPGQSNLRRQVSAPVYARIASVTYAGPGCPSGTASLSISDNLTVMTAIFSEFSIQTYGAVSEVTSCQVNIDLDFPSGWSYTVTGVVQRGHATLGANITATVGVLFYFSGSGEQVNWPCFNLQKKGADSWRH